MKPINLVGVLKGGVVAGLIMNVSEFIFNVPVAGARMEAELKAINLPAPGGGAIALFTLTTLALGILLIWVYAAIRPRLGPGPKTAICAGLLVWTLSYLYASVFFGGIGVNSWGLIALGLVWSLVECALAALAGAYLYSE